MHRSGREVVFVTVKTAVAFPLFATKLLFTGVTAKTLAIRTSSTLPQIRGQDCVIPNLFA